MGRYKTKKNADFRLKISELVIVGMTGFEPATTRPPDVYSNRAELHPERTWTLVVLIRVARERLELSTS